MGDKWNDVERVRKLIVACNARKNRGSSFVESGELESMLDDSVVLYIARSFRHFSKLIQKSRADS